MKYGSATRADHLICSRWSGSSFEEESKNATLAAVKEERRSMVTIYHNPRCSKSRATLKILEEKGIEPTIIEYLQTPPDAKTLDGFLTKLGMEPRDLMRKGEAPYKELNLKDQDMDRPALIKAMVENPILIERPLVVNGAKVALGRPPENVLGIL
jgi:arsenate reductase